jgi:hypothetical protein
VTIKCSFVRNVTLCSPLKVNRRFRVTTLPTLGLKSSTREETGMKHWLLPTLCPFLACLTLQPWRWRRYVPPKRLLAFSGLQENITLQVYPCFRLFTYTNITVWVSSKFILQTGFGAHPTSYPNVPRATYPKVKWPGHEADHLPTHTSLWCGT